MHRAGQRLARDRNPLAHLVERVFRRDRRRPFDERAQQRLLVDQLVGVNRLQAGSDLASEHDDGRTVEQSLRDCRRRIGNARAKGGHQHAGLAGKLIGRIGHDAGAQFLLGEDEFDADFAKSLEQFQYFAAGDAEREPDAVLVQCAGYDVCCLGHYGTLPLAGMCGQPRRAGYLWNKSG